MRSIPSFSMASMARCTVLRLVPDSSAISRTPISTRCPKAQRVIAAKICVACAPITGWKTS
jgi:hypothetical protein